jgi:hypothetical protein
VRAVGDGGGPVGGSRGDGVRPVMRRAAVRILNTVMARDTGYFF